ncbi:hypothetical protein G6F24_018097 [Rhizopus arrhizus]|nr:hypothetical protein G6F24_018097 [Rhizopus arrhizus]
MGPMTGLTGKVDVRSIVKNHRRLREAVARQRARLLQPGEASHDRLDGISYALLRLQRRIAWRAGVDLDLNIGNVRDSVNGQPRVVVDPYGSHPQGK